MAEVDTYNPNALDERRLPTGSKRWKEWAVYETESGKIVCSKLGRSQMPGEFDKGDALIIDVAAQESTATIRADLAAKGIGSIAVRPATPVEDQLRDFFGQSAMAKDLFAELKIESDVEVID